MRRTILSSVVLLALITPGVARSQSAAGGDLYKLLATTKTSTMQKELDEASTEGYRIVMGSPTAGNEMALFLQRVAKPPDTYAYKLLATTRTGTMERELNELAEGGYRLMPSTMIAKKQIVGGIEIVALLERPPMAAKQYEYKLLATSKTGTLQREASEAQAAGFIIVGMVSRGEHMVVMERDSTLKK
jgi:hypothetical protein